MRMNMKIKSLIVAAVALVVVGVSGYAWMHYVLHPEPKECGYCLRPLHQNLRVTAEIDGKRAEVCCPHCAITEANQQHKQLKLITVHDYPTGEAIKPEAAWYVEGSRVNACDREGMHMNEMKETQDLAFDRCSPGTFTFANKANADAFVSQNGGLVLSFTQLMREVQFK
jgi:hypothetical protein